MASFPASPDNFYFKKERAQDGGKLGCWKILSSKFIPILKTLDAMSSYRQSTKTKVFAMHTSVAFL